MYCIMDGEMVYINIPPELLHIAVCLHEQQWCLTFGYVWMLHWYTCVTLFRWCMLVAVHYLPFWYPCTYYSDILSLHFSRDQHKWNVNSRCEIQEMKIVHLKKMWVVI